MHKWMATIDGATSSRAGRVTTVMLSCPPRSFARSIRLVAGLLEVGLRHGGRQSPRRRTRPWQAVRAQHRRCRRSRADPQPLGRRLRPAAPTPDAARHDVAPRIALACSRVSCRCWTSWATSEMILRELPDRALPHEVRAAVADVREIRLGVRAAPRAVHVVPMPRRSGYATLWSWTIWFADSTARLRSSRMLSSPSWYSRTRSPPRADLRPRPRATPPCRRRRRVAGSPPVLPGVIRDPGPGVVFVVGPA